MKIIQNKLSDLMLAKGFASVTIWPFIFVRTDVTITRQLLNHEEIHGRQQLEMLWLPFFVWYVIEWLIRLCINRATAYWSIAFEQEAYHHDRRDNYLLHRTPYAWVRYYFSSQQAIK